MTGRRNRRESFVQTRPTFTEQEQQVMIQINMGVTDAWSISYKTGMLTTSVRRCLTDLVKKNAITENGTVYHAETNRNVTAYRTLTQSEAFTGQGVLL